jgi:acyl-protein synthetase LuxE
MPALAPTALRARLADVFRRDLDEPLRDDEFDALAREIFAFQYENNVPYAAYCKRRGRTPAQVTHWTEIPPVPTVAFREVALVAGLAEQAGIVFRTSGTTHGAERRGVHYIVDPSVYEAALLPLFAGYLLPDRAELAFVSLIPGRAQLADSSLSYMVAHATKHLARVDAGSFIDAERGLREADLEQTLNEFILHDTPVLLLGTSFAFVHWLDSMSARGVSFLLPSGSRLMDTGGFKGRSRSVSEMDLRTAFEERLGLPAHFCINEYGMSELCSQFYDPVLRDRVLGRTPPVRPSKRPAPWVRTRAVHPETLAPVAEGETGILQHFDLANLYSVLAVQTEDLGRVHIDGFELLGRAPGATPRGCSMALDLLLEAAANQT